MAPTSSMIRSIALATLLLASANAFVAPTCCTTTQTRVTTTTTLQSSPLDFFTGDFKAISNLFTQDSSTTLKEKKEPTLPDVVIDPSFKLAGIFLVAGIALDFIPYIQLTLGPLVTLLGILFLVQTFRIRFTFDETNFELRMGDDLSDVGENVVVGGENKWPYDSFVNWEFFPEGWIDAPQGPILAYFKETATPSDKWNEGPGQSANSEEALAKGAVPGQVHFFPILCDAQQLRDEFVKRKCAKLE
jgi:hypothetical protein